MRAFAAKVGVYAAVVAAALTAVHADSWYDHYDRGEAALRQGRWQDAVNEISQAIKLKGDPGLNVRTYGTNFVDYTPYLKLGEAYLELGDPDAALQALATEEQLGAVVRSKSSMSHLSQLRRRAETERSELAAKARSAAATTISAAIAAAEEFEKKGQIDAALGSIGRALAVEPNDSRALEVQQRLRRRVAEAEQAAQDDQRVAHLVEEGKAQLTAGRFQDASSLFSQALAVKRTPEAETLLQSSQSRLREQVTANRDAESRRQTVTDALAIATRLEKAGDIAGALSKIQEALAVDPGDPHARTIRERLAASQAALTATEASRETVDKLLAEGRALLDAHKPDDALRSFNRVLALDPKNAPALEAVARAYEQFNQAVLGRSNVPKFPPAIRFLDDYNARDDEGELRAVDSARFQLNGMIVSQQPVGLSVTSAPREAPQPLSIADSAVAGVHVATFTKEIELRPGLNEIETLVRGSDGEVTRRAFRVRYDRPWTRSPWLASALTAVVLAGATSVIVRRRRRQNRLRTRRFNPFIAGAPVMTEDLFLGREALIARILQSVHNNSILLYGERRIGKTSLQHHLKRRLRRIQDPEYAFYPVYIDLQGTPEDRFFRTLGDDIFEELAPELDGRVSRAPLAEGEAYSYSHLFREIRDILGALKSKTAKRVKLVLLIDEVDELNAYDPRVNQKVRSLFMKSFAEDLAAIVSGVSIKKHWESEGSPWYNFFEEIEVKPFSPKDAQELIERPVRGVLQFEAGVVEAIVAKTGGRPYLIQKLCIALVNEAYDAGRRRIGLGDVEGVDANLEG